MRGRAWYSRVSAHTQLANKLRPHGRYIYTNSSSRFTFTELATGRGTLRTRASSLTSTASPPRATTRERPTHLADVGFTWRVTPKLQNLRHGALQLFPH